MTVIARIGTILVDGKVYPPPPGPASAAGVPQVPGAVQNRSKQPSPNITPPLRPGMPGPGMTSLSANSSNGPGGFPNVPPMYNGNGGVPVGGPFPPNHPMGRSFAQENGPGGGFGRFPMGPPHGMPPQQHVSSSTHPQNMGELWSDPQLTPWLWFWVHSWRFFFCIIGRNRLTDPRIQIFRSNPFFR